jgi:hypothetical protein
VVKPVNVIARLPVLFNPKNTLIFPGAALGNYNPSQGIISKLTTATKSFNY